MVEQSNTPVDPATVAADTVGANLLQAIVDELDALEPWRKLDTLSQDSMISRLRDRVTVEVSRALRVILAGDYPACAATLTGVTFADGIAVKLRVDKTAHHRHELADATGQSVLVVMANPGDHLASMETVRARAKQGDLFGGVAPDTVIGDEMADEAITETAYSGVVGEGEPSDDLVTLLRRCELDVTFNDTARWGPDERAQAMQWARDWWAWLNRADSGPVIDERAPEPPPCVAPLRAAQRSAM